MTFQELDQQIRAMAEKKGPLGVSFKFSFPGGIVVVQADGSVTNENVDADCTIAATEETFAGIMRGETNPMMAVMTGKVKISGDMSVAMKLQQLL